jgi:uncharacterized membrane protein
MIDSSRQADVMTDAQVDNDHHQAALRRGRLEGLAAAALATACVSFINLLGAEKALLAITLGGLALSGLHDRFARRRAWAAIGLSGFYVATLVGLLFLYHEKLGHLVELLKELG